MIINKQNHKKLQEIFNNISEKSKKNARQETFNNIFIKLISNDESQKDGITKIAFDTRHIDQENERNPRTNCQYWHRSQEFIDKEDEKKVTIFAKLIKPLNIIKEKFGNQPEYHNSYSRILLDTIERTLRLRDNELELFRPQINYVEQLLDARYRLRLDDIEKLNEAELTENLLRKDEDLVKRAMYMLLTENKVIKNSNEPTQQSNYKTGLQTDLGNLILGGDFRRSGEQAVERTITIKIRDEVVR